MTDHAPLPHSTHGWRIDPRHALIAGLLCWAGFAAMAVLMQSGRMGIFDAAGLKLWRDHANLGLPRGPGWLIEAVRDYTALGGLLLRHLFALAAVGALLFLRLRREAVLFAATVMSGWLVGSALKALFGRARPDIVPHLMAVDGASFPSGHSFNAAVVYVAMALAFAALSPLRRLRWTLIGCALALTFLVGLSRVWLGVHYPSDVVAGWLGGTGWAFLASAVLYRPAAMVAEAGT